MWNVGPASRILACAILAAAALGAQAADVWVVTPAVKSGVETMKQYPDLITVEVKKNNSPAPDDTKVNLSVITGDAQLLDPATSKLGNTVQLKTKGGTVSATVFMKTQPRALITVQAVDDTGNLLDASDTPVDLNATDFIPTTGEKLKCFKDTNGDGIEEDLTLDCREDDTSFTFYTGYAVNTFAAPALGGTTADAQSRDAQSSDTIAGLDFSHAIFRRGPSRFDKDGNRLRGRGELWVYGETLHGIASTNNCSGANSQEQQPCEADAAPESLNGIIEGANTLEAYAGLRYEPEIGLLDQTASRAYIKAQLGFISIVGHGNDLIDNHHLGLGMAKVHGRFTDSYFEIGYGRNDLFAVRNKGRWKVDGFIAMNMKYPHIPLIRPFIQLTADTDFGSGGDSVQSFFGLDFDLTLLRVFSVPGRP